MPRRLTLGLGVLACVAASLGCATRARTTAAVSEEIARGDKARRHHHLPWALEHYERAERDAALIGAGPLEAEAGLKRVRVIQMLSSKSRLEKYEIAGLDTPERRRVAIRTTYERVMAVGSTAQQALARNNLAVLMFGAGDHATARDLLHDIPGVGSSEASGVPAAELAIYLLNHVRALERTADYGGAYAQAKRLVRMRPRYRPGVRKAFRLLQILRPPRVTDAVDLLDVVMTAGRPRQAAQVATDLVGAWSDEPEAVRLLPALARSWIASGRDCATFPPSTWRELERGAPLRGGVRELEAACHGSIQPPALVGAGPGSSPFPTLIRVGGATDLSRLLVEVGDRYVEDDDAASRQALARYLWASRVDARNAAARLYAASLLDADARLDPDGRIARSLLPPSPDPSDHDLRNEVRLRIVLGRIFEREGRLGPPSLVDTAIFQWQWVMDHERGPGAGADVRRSPETYLRLGAAYGRTGDVGRARLAYGAALEEYERTRNSGGAVTARAKLEALPH